MSQVSSDDSQILQLMRNPTNLQIKLIEHLESKLLGGNAVLNDPNSVAMHLIEGFSCVTADYAFATQMASERRLPARVQSMSDLYLHMSDYDYVGCFATPSQATITIGLDKEYILNHGVLENGSYRVVKIPKDTEFTLGNAKFSIYYPILIQVDERTKIPLVTYDVSEQHPLMGLESNRLNFIEQSYLNYNLVLINLTIYQFTRTTKTVTLDKTIGFSETYQYTDKFYAVRLFTDYNGSKIELGQTFTQENYDATKPTARIQVMPDTKKVAINIPQTYFNQGFIGSKLYIELYTTLGDVILNVGNIPLDQMKVNFKLDKTTTDDYTKCMMYNPTLLVNVTSSVTSGGGDGYTYEEIRQRVINDSFHTKAQITPTDISNYYADYNIKVERYEDNLTNLIYFAYKTFSDTDGQPVQSTNTYLSIAPDAYDTVSSITRNPDNSLTILPSTWFKYVDGEDKAIPLTNDEVSYLSELDSESLINEFNNNSYVRTPFHIRLGKSSAYPVATSYNLMQPVIEKITVTEDNPESLAQMLIIGESITHQQNGQGGYLVKFIIKKDLLDEVPLEAQNVWLYTTSSENVIVGCEAVYTGVVDGYAIYQIEFTTSYWLDSEGNLEFTNVTDGLTTLNHSIPLEATWHAVFMCNQEYFPDVDTPTHMLQGVPTTTYRDKIVLLRQSMVINFGHCIDDVVFNHINLTWTKQSYQRHEIDVFEVYPETTYICDAQGIPILDENGELQVEHTKGDTIIGDDGNPVYKYKKGDIYLDTNGQPVKIDDRVNEYLIQAPVFDGKLYVSQYPVQQAFIENLPRDFESYFKIITDARGYITERTSIYFKPTKTMGRGTFQVGNGVKLTIPLTISMSFKLHVDPSVNTDDTLKEAVTSSVVSIVKNMLLDETISQTKIADTIRDSIDYVVSVDCLGINGDKTIQTLTLVDGNTSPSLKKVLTLSEDNLIVLKDDLKIDFVDAY